MSSASSFSLSYLAESSQQTLPKSYGSNVSKRSKVSVFVLSDPDIPANGGDITAADSTLQITANGADGWGEFLGSLNRSLDPLDLELSRIRNEVTGKDVYALVSAPQLSPINSLLG
jgi:hypothetical protein